MMNLHRHTPTLTVIDPRALAVRSIAYCRSASEASSQARINRVEYSLAGGYHRKPCQQGQSV